MARREAGKLKWAGRAAVTGALSGPAPRDEIEADCATFGIAPPPRSAPQADGLFEEHLAPLNAFLAVDTQWRTAPYGWKAAVTGLDYAAAEAGLRIARIELSPREWADFRVIEAAAMAALNRA